MFSDYVNKLRKTLSSEFFLSVNGRTSLTKPTIMMVTSLFTHPLAFQKSFRLTSVRITWATRLFSLTKTASRLWLYDVYQLSGVTPHYLKAKPEVDSVTSVKPYRPQQTKQTLKVPINMHHSSFSLPSPESHYVSSASVSPSRWFECKSLKTRDNRAVRMSGLCRWLSLQGQLW